MNIIGSNPSLVILDEVSMADRELLQLAANAAGYNVRANHYGVLLRDRNEQGLEYCAWNPLTDDGDALRLAVSLGINIYLAEQGFVTTGRSGVPGQRLALGNNPQEATRRAIILAAAEIGKSLL